ncbi:hypothetical protein KUCAC02_007721 [Chaenocephalus aceratus]|uniref:Uncharacterized protein n=1 Tax=Chaenocephalus aceratus TaxID=36190 RepID=A0ACB9X8C3_CHAAC|nr:hypothetical protein KUCAC02_007721 [Chaenocephalus aceratus]
MCTPARYHREPPIGHPPASLALGVYVFTVGLPAVLFVRFMWPDKRFGPPDQEYYYKKSDDTQPDDPEFSKQTDAVDIKGTADRARGRSRDTHGNTTKGDLDLKVRFNRQ